MKTAVINAATYDLLGMLFNIQSVPCFSHVSCKYEMEYCYKCILSQIYEMKYIPCKIKPKFICRDKHT